MLMTLHEEDFGKLAKEIPSLKKKKVNKVKIKFALFVHQKHVDLSETDSLCYPVSQ